jgi:hypothetical protein
MTASKKLNASSAIQIWPSIIVTVIKGGTQARHPSNNSAAALLHKPLQPFISLFASFFAQASTATVQGQLLPIYRLCQPVPPAVPALLQVAVCGLGASAEGECVVQLVPQLVALRMLLLRSQHSTQQQQIHQHAPN